MRVLTPTELMPPDANRAVRPGCEDENGSFGIPRRLPRIRHATHVNLCNIRRVLVRRDFSP